jgi:hypothetical protein
MSRTDLPGPRASRARRAAGLAVLAWAAIVPSVARAQCPAPPDIATQSRCDGVLVGWSGPRLGTTFRIYRQTAHQTPQLIASDTASPYLDTTAQPGVTYQYYVLQFGGACGTTSPPAGPAEGISGMPATPTGLTADDALSCDVVNLSWNAVPLATSYDLRRGTNDDLSEASVLATTTATSFVDTTASPTKPHWYWVRARSAADCVGAFHPVGEPGRRKPPKLPDLVVDPVQGANYTQFAVPALGQNGIFIFPAVANLGTMPLHLFPLDGHSDGTKDFYQRSIDCEGRTLDRFLGRFGKPPGVGDPTLPCLVRTRLLVRTETGGTGAVVATSDAPAHCVTDFAVFDSTLAGWSATAQFPSCSSPVRGLSIGWKTRVLNTPNLDLRCVANGAYYIEHTVDPDHRILELDETNNVMLTPITLSNLPTPAFPPCTNPRVVLRLRGPDSLVVATGAPTDSITASIWAGGITEAPIPLVNEFVEFGYAPRGPTGASEAAMGDPWVWLPGEWRRHDGAEDVFGVALTVAPAGDYDFAVRFTDDDGVVVLGDLDGSQNGFSYEKAGKLRVQDTTSAGEGERWGALDFAVRSNPAHGTTRFALTLPEATAPRIEIFDVRGRLVRALAPGPLAAGPHTIEWDGRHGDGARAHAGIYFARLVTARGERLAAKWVLAP